MTVRRLLAIAVIFVGCAIAWFTLGWSLVVRTGQFDRQLTEQVSLLWGAPQVQLAPESRVARPREIAETVLDTGDSGRGLEREVRKTVTEWIPVPLASTRVEAALDLDHRQKGLLWYDTYAVAFRGTYIVENPDAVERQLRITFSFPSPTAIYDDFTLTIDGTPADRTGELGKEIQTLVTLGPQGRATLEVGYRSRGLDHWRYAFGASGIAEVRDFELSLLTNFRKIDFPAGTMSPTERTETGDGWQIAWRFANLVTGQAIGLDLPNRINPGPLAARITFFAPVSLLFFLTVMVILDMLWGESLHPMHYLFISAAFFAFHLLLAYLVDRLPLLLSFGIAAAVSLGLVGSYLAAATRVSRRLKPALAAQAIYLLAFSAAFFFEGFTGLAVTIGAIITLFVLMQLTARLNWAEVFGDTAANRGAEAVMKRDTGAVLEAGPAEASGRLPFIHRVIRIATTTPAGYVDLTDELSRLVAQAHVGNGLLHVQTRHTTTGLLINECEPLLLVDIDARLERWAPAWDDYGHDDPSRRTVNLVPGERRNGHAHCRAMLFRVSETVHIVDGRLALGRWQRVMFVELDGPQSREVSVMIQF